MRKLIENTVALAMVLTAVITAAVIILIIDQPDGTRFVDRLPSLAALAAATGLLAAIIFPALAEMRARKSQSQRNLIDYFGVVVRQHEANPNSRNLRKLNSVESAIERSLIGEAGVRTLLDSATSGILEPGPLSGTTSPEADAVKLRLSKILEANLDVDKLGSDELRAHGNLYFSVNRIDDSIAAYERSAELRPDYRTYNNLGRAYGKLRRYRDSEKYLRKSLELRDKNPRVLNSLGAALLNLSEHREALRCFEMSINISPHSSALANLAMVYYETGNPSAADEQIRLAIRLDPDNPSIRYSHALVLYAQNKLEQATAIVDKLIKDETPDGATYSLRASIAHQLNDYEDAIHFANLAIELRPSNSTWIFNKACHLSMAGRYDEAYEELHAAVLLGFAHADDVETDSDLEPLRIRPEYRDRIAGLVDRIKHSSERQQQAHLDTDWGEPGSDVIPDD